MSELADIRRDLEEIEAMRKAIGSFGTRYRRYAQVATRRRARTLRQAQTDFDNASRDVNAAQTELDEARARVTRYQSQQQSLDEQLAADEARLRVLRSDPIMRDANRLSTARDRPAECRELVDKPVVARWDDRLNSAMSERRVVVHEEGVAETLMMDLAASTDSEGVP